MLNGEDLLVVIHGAVLQELVCTFVKSFASLWWGMYIRIWMEDLLVKRLRREFGILISTKIKLDNGAQGEI